MINSQKKQPTVDITQDPALIHSPDRSPVSTLKSTTIVISVPKYHWTPSPPDPRDIPYIPIPIDNIPSKIDLRQYCSPVDDQGQISSCTGNAIAGAIDLIDNKTESKIIRVSRLFIYYQERLLEGDISSDNGAYIRDGIKSCNQIGAPLETLWPYDTTKFAVNPSDAAYSDASQRKVIKYSSCADFNTVKNALANGIPVVIGFQVYSSFETPAVTQTGIMPYPNTTIERLLGGHAVLLCGYDDSHSWFIARNSWGTAWGDNGYFYMPYQVIENAAMSSEFWAIESVANPNS